MLSSQGNAIAYLDKTNEMTTCTLSQLMHAALRPNQKDPAQAKFVSRLIEKLRYCKEVLISIVRNANAPQQPPSEPDSAPLQPPPPSAAGLQAVNSRPSKASLR